MYSLKHGLLTGLLCLFTISLYSQNEALFSVESTPQAILMPTLTETYRNAISKPSTGLLIFQNTKPTGFYFYDGSQWLKIIEGSASVDDNDGSCNFFNTH